jgi:hypothetical protein
MPKRKLTCPECDGVLSVAGSVEAGKKIRCPKCSAIFRMPEADESAVSAGPPARRNERDDEDMDDDYESRPARRRRSRQPGRKGMPVAATIAIGAVVLIASAGVAALLAFQMWKKEPAPANVIRVEDPNARLQRGMPQGGAPGLQPPAPGFNLPQPKTNGPQPGQQAPEIEGEDIDGKRFKLSDYRGKVVLLDFWGNW